MGENRIVTTLEGLEAALEDGDLSCERIEITGDDVGRVIGLLKAEAEIESAEQLRAAVGELERAVFGQSSELDAPETLKRIRGFVEQMQGAISIAAGGEYPRDMTSAEVCLAVVTRVGQMRLIESLATDLANSEREFRRLLYSTRPENTVGSIDYSQRLMAAGRAVGECQAKLLRAVEDERPVEAQTAQTAEAGGQS